MWKAASHAHGQHQHSISLTASLLQGLTSSRCCCLQDKVGIQTWTFCTIRETKEREMRHQPAV